MVRSLIVSGTSIDIIPKKGCHSLKLRIDRKTGKPQVTVPFLYPTFMVQKFIENHIIWLQKQISLTPQKITFKDGMKLSILGQELIIQHQDKRIGGAFIEGNILIVTGSSEHLHRRVKDFIQKQVSEYVSVKAPKIAEQLNCSIKRITIKDTISRWGSCTSTGHLSFCWRLSLAPLFVLDYVIIHEVAHLVEMNHSWAFWKKVAELNANTRQAKKWLNENAPYLHSFL